MEEKNKFEETAETIKAYINTRYELLALETSDKAAGALSEILSGFLICFVFILALTLLSFAAAYYLSNRIGNSFSGFLIVGGVYVVIILFFAAFGRKLFKKPFRKKMLELFQKH